MARYDPCLLYLHGSIENYLGKHNGNTIYLGGDCDCLLQHRLAWASSFEEYMILGAEDCPAFADLVDLIFDTILCLVIGPL